MRQRLFTSGNVALCNGAIFWAFESGAFADSGGKAFFSAGYPITPVNEVTDYLGRVLNQFNGVFLQAESEIAAANMLIGAASVGVPAMTVTSSPGISLMQEAISYAAGMELGGRGLVYADVARGGPGLGNIQGSQSDFNQAVLGGGHGDYQNIVLAPASAQEMFDLARLAFKLSATYRIPGFILTDGYVGQIKESYEIPDAFTSLQFPPNRDVRTSIYVRDGILERHNWKLFRRYEELKKDAELEKASVSAYRLEDPAGDARIVILNYGFFSRIGYGVVDRARAVGIPVGQISLKALNPLPEKKIKEIVKRFGPLYVMEGAIDQLAQRVRTVIGNLPVVGVCQRPGGTLPQEEEIIPDLEMLVKKAASADFQKRLADYWKLESPAPVLCVNRGAQFADIGLNDSTYDIEYRVGMEGKTPEKHPALCMTDKTSYYCTGCDHKHSTEAFGKVFDLLKDFDITLYSPVGCSIFLYDFFKKDRITHIQVPHGRSPAAASGTKRVRPDSLVFCYQGDGDALDIGLGELLHAASRGEKITMVIMNNGTYGMTGGQMSSATPLGQFSKTAPKGRSADLHGFPIDLSKVLPQNGVSFYRRVLLGTPQANEQFLGYLLQGALHQLQNKGMSVIEVMATCVEHQRAPEAVVKAFEAQGKKPHQIALAKEYTSKVMSKFYPLTVGWGKDFENPGEILKKILASRKEAPVAPGAKTYFERFTKALGSLEISTEPSAVSKRTAKDMAFYLCGEGGQGIQSLADIIMRSGATPYAHNFPWYEPEVTKARTVAVVTLSNSPNINPSPQGGTMDVLLAMTLKMFFERRPYLKKGGFAIINGTDADLETLKAKKENRDCTILVVPATQIVTQKAGEKRSANLALFGALNQALGLFPDETVERAIEITIPKAAKVNIEAYRAGKAHPTPPLLKFGK